MGQASYNEEEIEYNFHMLPIDCLCHACTFSSSSRDFFWLMRTNKQMYNDLSDKQHSWATENIDFRMDAEVYPEKQLVYVKRLIIRCTIRDHARFRATFSNLTKLKILCEQLETFVLPDLESITIHEYIRYQTRFVFPKTLKKLKSHIVHIFSLEQLPDHVTILCGDFRFGSIPIHPKVLSVDIRNIHESDGCLFTLHASITKLRLCNAKLSFSSSTRIVSIKDIEFKGVKATVCYENDRIDVFHCLDYKAISSLILKNTKIPSRKKLLMSLPRDGMTKLVLIDVQGYDEITELNLGPSPSEYTADVYKYLPYVDKLVLVDTSCKLFDDLSGFPFKPKMRTLGIGIPCKSLKGIPKYIRSLRLVRYQSHTVDFLPENLLRVSISGGEIDNKGGNFLSKLPRYLHQLYISYASHMVSLKGMPPTILDLALENMGHIRTDDIVACLKNVQCEQLSTVGTHEEDRFFLNAILEHRQLFRHDE